MPLMKLPLDKYSPQAGHPWKQIEWTKFEAEIVKFWRIASFAAPLPARWVLLYNGQKQRGAAGKGTWVINDAARLGWALENHAVLSGDNELDFELRFIEGMLSNSHIYFDADTISQEATIPRPSHSG